MMVSREAPSDERTENSRDRSMPRASTSAVTLVQAISRRMETAPKSSHKESRAAPTVVSLSCFTSTVRSVSVAGNCLAS